MDDCRLLSLLLDGAAGAGDDALLEEALADGAASELGGLGVGAWLDDAVPGASKRARLGAAAGEAAGVYRCLDAAHAATCDRCVRPCRRVRALRSPRFGHCTRLHGPRRQRCPTCGAGARRRRPATSRLGT